MGSRIVYSPTRFFTLTFLISWVCWFAAPAVGDAESGGAIFAVLMLIGLLAPFATALYLVLASRNPTLKKVFLNKLLNLRLIQLRSTLTFLVLFPATMIVSISISTWLGYSFDQFALAEQFSFTVGAVPTLLVLVLAACFEELGWRGYGVESLNQNRSYFEATAIFGVLWSLWHLPMFFIPNSYQAGLLEQDFRLVLNFFVSIVPLAFIVSWLCSKNSGSILGAVLMHAMINFTQELFQVSPYTKCIQTLVLIVVAVVLVVANKETFFGKSTRA